MLVLFVTPRLAWELDLHSRSTSQEALSAVGRRDWPLGPQSELERNVAVAIGPAGQVGRILGVGRFVAVERPVQTAGRRRRSSITVSPLGARHPLSRLVGTSPEWCVIGRNPVKYVDAGLETSECLCGCGTQTSGAVARFLPGHDQRMLHDRIQRYFAGSILDAVGYMDSNLAGSTPRDGRE